MPKSVTIKDIAAEAGVSIALVSFVMNNRIGSDGKRKYRVNEATREKILEVAGRLNYQPSSAARMLRSGHSKVIGVLLSDISNVFYGEIARSWRKWPFFTAIPCFSEALTNVRTSLAFWCALSWTKAWRAS